MLLSIIIVIVNKKELINIRISHSKQWANERSLVKIHEMETTLMNTTKSEESPKEVDYTNYSMLKSVSL